MRITKAFVLAVLAACGGSQDTASDQTQMTGTDDQTAAETPPVEETKPVEVKPTPPPPPAAKKLTLAERIAFHESCFQDFISEEPGFVDRCYTEASSEEEMDGGQGPHKGKAAIAASTKAFWDGFTFAGESVATLGSGDNVVTVGLLTGVHDGTFMGMPATNKSFGMLFAEVQDLDQQGRHGTVRLYFDPATLVAQLGAAKMPHRKVMSLSGKDGMVVIATDSAVENQNVELVRAGFDLFNKHDSKALAARYADGAVFAEQSMPMDVKGMKAIEGMLKELFVAFPDASETIGTIWGAGDYVVAETVFAGTNKGKSKMMGLTKATGKPVSVHGAHVFKIEGGKVAQHWVFANGMAFAMQLGLMPPPGEAKHK